MRRMSAWLILAALLAVSAVAIAADIKQLQGSVVFACPKGKAVKVKVGDVQVTFWVHPNCPKRAHLCAQIKALKAGDQITVKYFTQGEKHYLTQIVKQ